MQTVLPAKRFPAKHRWISNSTVSSGKFLETHQELPSMGLRFQCPNPETKTRRSWMYIWLGGFVLHNLYYTTCRYKSVHIWLPRDTSNTKQSPVESVRYCLQSLEQLQQTHRLAIPKAIRRSVCTSRLPDVLQYANTFFRWRIHSSLFSK